MALELYSEQYWLPTGVLSANTPAVVFPRDSNAFAALFADQAGTIPIPNPGITTDGTGTLTFYATVGEYWVHIDSETFLINAGLSETQAGYSTGVASGGDISPSLLDPFSVTIEPLIGYIVDNIGETSVKPTIRVVDFPGGEFQLDAPGMLRTVTYWTMDATGAVMQSATRPTPQQYRQSLVLGLSVLDTGAGMILEAQTLPTILPQLANAHVDLADSLGPFSILGNAIMPAGVGLSIAKAQGTLFSRAAGYVSGGVVTDNPNIVTSPAASPAIIRRIIRTALVPTPPPVLTVDPANYDLAGVLTPIPGGPSTSSVQRVYLFAADTPSLRIAVQYAQTVYASLQIAVASISSGQAFEPAPVTQLGTLIGYIAMTRSCTDLSDPAQATFVYSGRFGTP